MKKKQFIVLLITNLILVILVTLSIMLLSKQSSKLSYVQNLENIRTLTDASSNKVKLICDSYFGIVERAARYANEYQGTGMTEQELIAYISEYYSACGYSWQLVNQELDETAESYTNRGFVCLLLDRDEQKTDTYNPLAYPPLALLFHNASAATVGTVHFTTEFTDAFTLKRSFAAAATVALKTSEGVSYKTLMLSIPSEEINQIIELNNSTDNHTFFNFSNIIVDQEGDYVISNRYFQDINFIEYIEAYNGELPDKDKSDLLSRLKTGDVEEPLIYKNNRNQTCVYTLSPVKGTDWLLLSLVPEDSFHNTHKIGFGYYLFFFSFSFMFLFDILYAIALNVKLRSKSREAEEASRAKGDFMSKMSHEIRTPLNAIIGYNMIAQNEMSEAKDDADRRQAEMKTMDCLIKSGIASKHLLTVINDVLDMSAIESGKIRVAHERFDFKGLVTSLTAVFYSQANAKGVTLEVILGKLTEEWLVGDQLRVSQILTNLLSNAIKFTEDGGHVKLRISELATEEKRTKIHFEVEDDGIGMTEDYLSHIWTPFEQADSTISRRYGGSGLGLAITKNLVELMKGSIAVESVVGEGTTFSVDLFFERTVQPNRLGTYDFSDVNALIVDDDSSTCDYIKLLFERCGARSEIALSGHEAVERFAVNYQTKDPYTLVLVDWRMPKMDGIETIKRLRKIAKNGVPIIVITAYDYSEIAEKAAEVGVTRFLAKPLFQSSIMDLLANICNKKGNEVVPDKKKAIYHGEKILLAEDNAMNMEIAKKILNSAGLVVDGAWNGREVTDKFIASEPGTYRMILMDIHMPDVNGYQATENIRNSVHPEAKTIPIVAMTADAFAEDVAQSLAAGMNDHISKPIDVRVLHEKLDQYINQGKNASGFEKEE